MNAVSSIALTGMSAARVQLDTSAHNIANSQTPGFQRQAVERRELPDGGVAVTVEQTERSVPSLPTDLVEQMTAQYDFQANLHTLRTQQDMIGTMLDVMA